MKILEDYSKSNIIRYFIVFVVFISWLLPFTNQNDYLFYEDFGLVFVGIIAFLCLLLFKDTYYILEILLLVPFMFSHEMDLYTIPRTLFYVIGLVLLGFIIHIFIYKQKLRTPKLFFGFLLIGISLVLGGLLTEFDDKLLKMGLLLFIVVVFLLFYAFLTSSTNSDFEDLKSLMSMLGLLICLQVVVYSIINKDVFLMNKDMDIGWARSSNSTAMILLLCVPFALYNAFKNKGFKSISLYALTLLELVCLIFTYSRGALASALVTCLAFLVVFIVIKETRIKVLIFAGTAISALALFALIFYIKKPDIFDSIIYHISKFNLENLNGRLPIYQDIFKNFKNHPIFGHSVFYLYGQHGDNPNFYFWAHNTFLQAAYTLGSVGLVAMLYHFIEKYYLCFKNINLQRIILLFAFIQSDIYGFFDVSYFFINFMIVLVIILIMSDSLLDKPLIRFKRKKYKQAI